MKRFIFCFTLVALTFAQTQVFAGDIYFVGDDPAKPGSSRTLQIVFNTLPENYSFMNGGIALALNSSNPGVIEFTGGTVINDDGRWAAAVVQQLTNDRVGRIFGASVLTPGLPSGTAVTFAEINYNVIGPVGSSTTLSIEVLLDGLYQGSPPDGDVTQSFNIADATVTVIPEPTCFALSALGAFGLGGRRRFGRTL